MGYEARKTEHSGPSAAWRLLGLQVRSQRESNAFGGRNWKREIRDESAQAEPVRRAEPRKVIRLVL